MEDLIDSSGLLLGVVYDGSAGGGAVGNVDHFVVQRSDLRVNETDLFDGADSAAHVYEIADLKRPGDEDEQTAREVGDSAVDRHADAYAEGCDDCRDAGGVDAQIADEPQNDQDL